MQEDNNPYGGDSMPQPNQYNDQTPYTSQQPTDSVQQPDDSAQQPSGTAQQQPSGTAQQQPSGTAQQQPSTTPVPQQPVDSTSQESMNQMPQQPSTNPVSQQQSSMGGMPPQQPMNPTLQQPMGMPPQQQMGMMPKRPGMALAALILGIIAIVMFWIPIVGIGCGIAALVTGIMSMRKIKANRLPGKNMSVAGIVTGIIGMVLSVVMAIASFSIGMNMVNKITNSSSSATTSVPSHGKSDPQKGLDTYNKTKGKELKGSGSFGGADVKIVSAQKGPNDDQGHPTVVITYQYKNTDTENHSFIDGVQDQVFQKGVALKSTYYRDEIQGFDEESRDTAVQPGGSLNVTVAYALNDETSPIDVELRSAVNFDDQTKITQTFNLK
ncbi:DUF5067 domain-containing protein [Bifidobacterium sp. ESL0732]|uniref:DUF5067 domain-containing protein n=1 Tax=Bifidobacterium sp. ESL0732 TaxID=2983222 RepID=UPI0023F943A5|nr:DUF5067 domain-containing protein [Bifidobacterium sp. ESL0732]WEV63963.1 DUF5067 domain-containing protein [Bifidobacterium sp. ESL0732]